MKYEQKSFTVPASSGGFCSEESGHAMADVRGNCLRCGGPVAAAPVPPKIEWKRGVGGLMYADLLAKP